MGGGSDPTLEAYLTVVAAGLVRVLGPALVGLYLHGSAALGGWSAELSDVDLLGVVARPLGRRAKREISARLNHPSLVCPAPAGLELSLVTAAVAADPPRQPPFEDGYFLMAVHSLDPEGGFGVQFAHAASRRRHAPSSTCVRAWLRSSRM